MLLQQMTAAFAVEAPCLHAELRAPL